MNKITKITEEKAVYIMTRNCLADVYASHKEIGFILKIEYFNSNDVRVYDLLSGRTANFEYGELEYFTANKDWINQIIFEEIRKQ